MNDMNFEHIDSLAQQAAENYQPSFDEKAWDDMNVLLDKEFGQKKRRFAFWWWLLPTLMLMGIGSYVWMNNKNNATDKTGLTTIAKQNTQPTAQQPDAALTDNKNNTGIAKQENQSTINNNHPVNNANNEAIENNNQKATTGTIHKIGKAIVPAQKKVVVNQNLVSTNNINIINKDIITVAPQNNNTNNTKVQKNNTETVNETAAIPAGNTTAIVDNVVTIGSSTSTNNNKVENSVIQKDSLKTVSTTTNKKKKETVSRWSVTAATGLERSFVRINEMQQASIKYGVGVNYQLNKRLSIATGFYAGSKLYSAMKQDYDFSKNPAFLYPNNVTDIDANCYVYDIPLTLRYNLTTAKKTNWFATAGISSYLMKREDYVVTVVYGSTSRNMNWDYYGDNKNYFSVLNLSFGAEKQLNKNMYLLVEPYYKLPLSGVGQGLVKLSSVGLQLGLRYQFLKKAKK